MKKEYLKPEQRIVVLQHKAMLMQGSTVTRASSNAGFSEEISGGSGPARVKSSSVWDDAW